MSLPPKPKGTPSDLAEVERALSVLKGRHPEHERARREDEEARIDRAASQARIAAMATSEARSRYLRVGAIALPVVLLVGFLTVLGRRELARRANIEKASEPFRAFGFTTVETSSLSARGTLEATVEPGCVLAVSTESAPIKLTRSGSATEGAGPTLFCTCSSERIGVASTIPAGGGLALLRADASSMGGSQAFPFTPFKPGATLGGDDACNEASLDAWIGAKRAPAPRAGDAWFAASPGRAPLATAGFRAFLAEPSTPFAVVAVPKESCLIATSSVASDRLSLRLSGGARPIPPAAGAFARCAQAEGDVVVAREGTGELAVLVAPAASVGGMRGLREIAQASDLPLATLRIPPADRPWDAKLMLIASQIPEATITTGAAPDVAVDKDARIAALSFETPNALTPETPADTFSYCDPPLDDAMRHGTCVFSGTQKWHTESGAQAIGGVARAKFPFWLFAMQTASDPKALKAITQLLELARHLGREGFTPTTLEALTELPTGVEVLGRNGEDAVVALGVTPSAPWVYPLSDGPAWTLDDAPHIVEVRPLERVTLKTAVRGLPPRDARRTVVFRRQVRPAAPTK